MFTYQASVDRIGKERENVALCMDSCVAAGYTGRDQASVQQHIDELKKLGVATPYAIPAMYWISPQRLTNHGHVVVVGDQTSPEVEYLVAADSSGKKYVTVASDHTDRSLESVSVGKSKQVCDKVLGNVFWPIDEIEPHWDDIRISSRVIKDGEWVAYQDGTLAAIMHFKDLLGLISTDGPAGRVPCLLSGTVPVIGGEMIYTSACEIRLSDPHLHREIVKKYDVLVLPDRS